MRKILFLPIILLILTGCIQYQELNRMALITTIAIDKKDEYHITLKETIPRKEENKVSSDYKYYQGSGKSIEEALQNASDNSSKDIYLKQVQNIMVTSPKYLENLPRFLKNRIVLFRTKNLEKALKTNSNYQYLNNLAKEKTVTVKDIRKKHKKKIPLLKVYKGELLIKD